MSRLGISYSIKKSDRGKPPEIQFSKRADRALFPYFIEKNSVLNEDCPNCFNYRGVFD